jgi:hypothetical protein
MVDTLFSNRKDAKLLNLLHITEFEISAPQCPTRYSLAGNGDVLDIVVHKNVWLSVIVSDLLDSALLPIVFHLLHHVRTSKVSDPVNKFTDCGQFQSLASELISPRNQIITAGRSWQSSPRLCCLYSLAYRLSTSNITHSDLNTDLPSLKSLLKISEV